MNAPKNMKFSPATKPEREHTLDLMRELSLVIGKLSDGRKLSVNEKASLEAYIRDLTHLLKGE